MFIIPMAPDDGSQDGRGWSTSQAWTSLVDSKSFGGPLVQETALPQRSTEQTSSRGAMQRNSMPGMVIRYSAW